MKSKIDKKMIIGGLAILLVAAVATVMILCFSGDGNGRKSRQAETASTADDARQTETASTADASEQRADVDPRNEKQNDSQGSSDGLAIGDPGSGEWIMGENGEQQFREPTGEIRKNQLFRYDGSIYYVDVVTAFYLEFFMGKDSDLKIYRQLLS